MSRASQAGPTLASNLAIVISSEVRRKLSREQRRVLALLHDLRAAVEAGDTAGLAQRASLLEESLDAHWALLSYVIESISEDDPSEAALEDESPTTSSAQVIDEDLDP